LVTWAIAAPLHAEPIDVTIAITSGMGSFNPDTGSGTSLLQLYGTDGFSLIAAPGNGATAPGCCLAPGTTTSFHGAWSGNDLPGVVTYNGDTFTSVGSLASINTAGVDFLSSAFTLPAPDGATSLTLTAPFTLTGFFRGIPGSGPAGGPPATVHATLVGSGIGTITFTWLAAFGGVWDPGIVTLQIGNPEDVVPEPSSIILACLSLAGVYGVRRHHRRRSL
jgi:hypothetical protein